MTTCEATIGYVYRAWGRERTQCGQVVGVTTWLDYFGEPRHACSVPGHLREVRRRFGTLAEADKHRALMEATELREGEDAPLAEQAPGELMEAWGK